MQKNSQETEVKKIMIVGQAPGPTGEGKPVFSTYGGKRLAKLLDMPLEEFHDKTTRINILPYFPGKNGKGDSFPIQEAKRAGAELMDKILSKATIDIVVMGKKTAHALGFGTKCEFFDTFKINDESTLHVFPHPSGISHYWNDPENVSQASSYLKKIFGES